MSTRTRHASSEETSAAKGPGPVVGSVCTGYGGLDLGVLAAVDGGRIAWVADPDPHITQILDVRMPGVPNLGDIRTIDWPAVEPVEVFTAGFPCQDISAAGRRLGIEKGARSGLWTDIVVGVRLLRPALVVVENVAALRWRGGGLHRVLGDLAEAGYDAAWRSVRASDIGAAHRRERVFLLAWQRPARPGRGGGDAANADRARRLLQRHLGAQRTGRSVAVGLAAVAADTDGLGRKELHPQNPNRWSITARRSSAAAHATSNGHRNRRTPSRQGFPVTVVTTGTPAGQLLHGPADPVAHTASDRRDKGLPSTTWLQRRPDAALGSRAAAGPANHSGPRQRHLLAVPEPTSTLTPDEVDWGVYAPAVRRWEGILGRRVPFPTQPGRRGRPVLAPAFVEWLQGLEPGWVTDLPLPRTAQLRALGNGVVPQQAAHAVALLLTDVAALTGAADAPARHVRRADRQEVDVA